MVASCTSPDVLIATSLRVGVSAASFAAEIARSCGLPWPLFTMRDCEDFSGFPEWIDNPDDRNRWRELNVPNSWFVYVALASRDREHPYLYIGMTGDLERRLLQHQRSRWWWGEVDRFIVTLCGSKREALDFERSYIERVSPCYNTQHYRGN